jgi:hypothetical protein
MPQKENISATPEPRSPAPVTCSACGQEARIILGEPSQPCTGCGASLPNVVVSFPGHIQSLATTDVWITVPIETGPLTFVTLQKLGLTPEQINEIFPTLYEGLRDYWASLLAKKAAARISDEVTLLDIASQLAKLFSSISAKPGGSFSSTTVMTSQRLPNGSTAWCRFSAMPISRQTAARRLHKARKTLSPSFARCA